MFRGDVYSRCLGRRYDKDVLYFTVRFVGPTLFFITARRINVKEVNIILLRETNDLFYEVFRGYI